MDRTAWIAVILCVLGLFAWQIWTSRQAVARPAAATTPSPAGTGISATPAAAQPAVGPTAAPSAMPLPFAERTETLRNSDVELHFTNRGGGIAQAILLNYPAEHDESVTLNSPARLPIGAIIDDPAIKSHIAIALRNPDEIERWIVNQFAVVRNRDCDRYGTGEAQPSAVSDGAGLGFDEQYTILVDPPGRNLVAHPPANTGLCFSLAPVKPGRAPNDCRF